MGCGICETVLKNKNNNQLFSIETVYLLVVITNKNNRYSSAGRGAPLH